MIGRRLSHYQLLEKLGAGGMGEVYLAEDTNLKRKVALKLLPVNVANDSERIERFKREARAVAALNHPHIVTIHSIEQAEGVYFLSMEFVEGETLDRSMVRPGMSLPRMLEIAIPLCEALAYAHSRGIVHRDLKPSNVMLGAGGRIKILDFGLAKFFRGERGGQEDDLLSLTQPGAGVVMGTAPYMSPEQIRGHSVDERSDIFSLGIMLYEMAAGRRPFQGNSIAEVASSILRDEPLPLDQIRPDLPALFSRIIHRCLQKQIERRFQSATEIQMELITLRTGGSEASDRQTATLTIDSPVRINSIAVLPLVNLSGSADEAFFADGLTDALITDLAKISTLKVISRTSVMHYKDTKKTMRQIAEELRVDAVVEGTVYRVGDRIRISVQLVNAIHDEHLWAERYDRKMEDVLALQDDLARAIIKEVNATLTRPTDVRRKVDPDVYLLHLRGRHALQTRTESSFRAAQELFQQAIDKDPTYAPAYIDLADALNMLANYGFIHPGEILIPSRNALEKGLQLDETSAEAHRVLAFFHWQFEFNWQAAISEYERALTLNPNSAQSAYFYGVYLGVLGSFQRAHQLLSRAEELDPLSLLIPAVQGWVRYFERKFSDAIPYYERVLKLDSNFHPALWFMGETLVEMGQFVKGIQALEKALLLAGKTSRLLGYLGYAYGVAGRPDDARKILEELMARKSERYVPPYFLALVFCGLGEHSNSLDYLEEAFRIKDTMLRDLKADAQWDRLREEPRFKQLFAAMAYPNF